MINVNLKNGKGKDNGVVYDISLDGSVVNALGMNVVSNTDGFNFQMPEEFRYTDENPYISKGLGRNYPKGQKFTKVEADVAEFEDLYMNENYAIGPNKMGLGIDEYVPASINFSRKNYADLLNSETGEVKLVGNTIKSKKMPLYIEKFLNKAINLLLYNKGKEFLDMYYDYIDDIYNLRIPLRDIASIGKIKTNIEDYIESCGTLTKAGSKKSRQAWYELVIKEGIDVHMGDAIYYINNGTKKNDSDVKRLTKYVYQDEDKTKDVEKEYNLIKRKTDPRKNNIGDVYENKSVNWVLSENGKYSCMKLDNFVKKYYPNYIEKDEIVFNCIMLNNDIINDEEDHYCDDSFEYNVAKYIEQFNKRIKPLLVCFSKDIRTKIDNNGKEIDNIIISNPSDRKQFTEEQCKLTSGEAYKEGDQDTYDALMTMEDKEISFWLSQNKKPLFVEECGMVWDDIVNRYNKKMEILKKKEVIKERESFFDIIKNLSSEEFSEFNFPESLWKIVDWDNDTCGFKSKKWDVVIATIDDLYEIGRENTLL